jgi:hypothetical protein
MFPSLTRRLLLSALAIFSLSRAASADEHGDPMGWLPDRQIIDELEAAIVMPPGAGPLTSYRRRYGGEIEAGRRVIWGLFLDPFFAPNDPPITILDYPPGGLVEDGGCSVVTLKFDVSSKSILRIQCNGEA